MQTTDVQIRWVGDPFRPVGNARQVDPSATDELSIVQAKGVGGKCFPKKLFKLALGTERGDRSSRAKSKVGINVEKNENVLLVFDLILSVDFDHSPVKMITAFRQ